MDDLSRARSDATAIRDAKGPERDILIMQWRTLANARTNAPMIYGWAVQYWSDDLGVSCLQLYPGEIRDAHRCLYIVDDGAEAVPHYVAGWRGAPDGGHGMHETEPRVNLHPFPLNGHPRADNGMPADFSSWMLAPARAYHLKVAPMHVDWCECVIDNAYGRVVKMDRACHRLRNPH